MSQDVSGFRGAVTGLSLTDVIQLKGHNKYTGAISVEYGESRGIIYFVDGEITHAEQGDESGEQAIYAIIKWPGGTFNIHPELASSVCTIHYRTDYLLLEALRRMDEDNAASTVNKSAPPSATESRPMSKIAARLQEINNVTYAVLLDKMGAPIQDSSVEALALADKGLFMAKTGSSIGELLGLGEIKAAAVHAANYDLLLYDSKQHYLSIAVKPDCNLDSVEAEIKAAFAQAR